MYNYGAINSLLSRPSNADGCFKLDRTLIGSPRRDVSISSSPHACVGRAEYWLLQRRNLATIEVFQFVKVRISKLNLRRHCALESEVSAFMNNEKDVNMSAILRFVQCVCLIMKNRFPENELMM